MTDDRRREVEAEAIRLAHDWSEQHGDEPLPRGAAMALEAVLNATTTGVAEGALDDLRLELGLELED